MPEKPNIIRLFADPATCQHMHTKVWKQLEQPKPIRCVGCGTFFTIADALKILGELEADPKRREDAGHDLPTQGEDWPQAYGHMPYAVISMNYAKAELDDPDVGEYFAIPDLGVECGAGKDSPVFMSEVFDDLITIALDELEEKHHLPPTPRDISELKKLFPKYAKRNGIGLNYRWTEY